MDIDRFVQRVNAMSSRLEALSRDANDPVVPRLDLLPVAFKELGIAAQELQAAVQELDKQQQQLISAQAMIAAERQRYSDLFGFTPECYIVTDTNGIIQQVNRATELLFDLPKEDIVGKALVAFFDDESRKHFNYNLAKRHQKNQPSSSLTVNLNLPNHKCLNVDISYIPMYAQPDQIVGLHWILRKKTIRVATQLSSITEEQPRDRPKDRYYKGETIPINHQEVYQVHKGVVKLTTMSDTGEEVLVGLANSSMLFGTSITALNIYQATALTNNVELVHSSLGEMLDSPQTTQKIIPQLAARLRQTELLLYISGQRRVKHRLYYLLDFLKQEIGQPVPQGTRLSVRFTHEEIASACCATRVTTTRQLNKLRQQGIISIDDEHHIVLLG